MAKIGAIIGAAAAAVVMAAACSGAGSGGSPPALRGDQICILAIPFANRIMTDRFPLSYAFHGNNCRASITERRLYAHLSNPTGSALVVFEPSGGRWVMRLDRASGN